MGLIKALCKKYGQTKTKEKIDIKKFLNTTLPCENIVKLTGVLGDCIYVLLEYSPSVIAILLNTNIDFNCKIKILSGRFVGRVYNVNRNYNANPSLEFKLTPSNKLRISAVGYVNGHIEIHATGANCAGLYFGDTITIKDLIKYIKLHGIKNTSYISKNLKNKEMIKRLYESENIFLDTEYKSCDISKGKEY